MGPFAKRRKIWYKNPDDVVGAPNVKGEPVFSETDRMKLQERIGRIHLQQRLGIQADHVSHVFGRGRNLFHPENWYSLPQLMRSLLRVVGLYGRGRRNAVNLQIRHNEVDLPQLPAAFNGFTILQLSDLHLDMLPLLVEVLKERLEEVQYDVCVMTGDFRAWTFGAYEACVAAVQQIRPHLRGPVYAVLGNHDFIEMVPPLEALEISFLLNEHAEIRRDGVSIYLAGIDDPHYYQVDNMEKALSGIPRGAVCVLLAHSPEVYKLAAHGDVDLLLCGHTHGGQMCLPGGVAPYFNVHGPRRICDGAWRHHRLQGYTSRGVGSAIVDVRFNCAPEITLHHLRLPPPHVGLPPSPEISGP